MTRFSLMDMRRLIVVALVLACVPAVQGSSVEKKPFFCLDTDICNKNDTDWQYCDETGEKRCRLCSKDKDTCFTAAMPRNCTAYCKERLIELERVKGCPPLNSTTHGHHNGSGTGTSYGETVQLECEAGYQCEGSCTVTCGEFGQYSGSPRCTENRCHPVLPPRNGYHSPVQHDYGMDEQIRISCREGFELKGDANATCMANGTWSISKMAACTLKQGNAASWSWQDVGIGTGIGIGIVLVIIFMRKMYVWCRRRRESKHSGEDPETSEPQTRLPLLPNRHETRVDIRLEDTNPPYVREMPPYRSRSDTVLSKPTIITPPDTPDLRKQSVNRSVGTMTESADSHDSGLGDGGKGKEYPVDIFNIININQNNDSQSNATTHDNPSANSSNIFQTTEPSRGNLPDKFPTEASPDKDGDCHGELQAHTMEHVDSVKPDQIKDLEETLSVHSLGFSAQEQVKIPPRDNMHAQPAGQVDDGNHPRMDDTLPKGVVISSDHSNGSTSNTGSHVQELNKIQPCKNMHCQPEEQSDTCMQKPVAIDNRNLDTGMECKSNSS